MVSLWEVGRRRATMLVLWESRSGIESKLFERLSDASRYVTMLVELGFDVIGLESV